MTLSTLSDEELEDQLNAIAQEQYRRKMDAALPANMTLTVYYDGKAWPERPTARTDITVHWVSNAAAPPPKGAIELIDLWWKDRP